MNYLLIFACQLLPIILFAQKIKTKFTFETIDSVLTKTTEQFYDMQGKLTKEIFFGQQFSNYVGKDTVLVVNPVDGSMTMTIVGAVEYDYTKISEKRNYFYDSAGKRDYAYFYFYAGDNGKELMNNDTLYYTATSNGYKVSNSDLENKRSNYRLVIDELGKEMRLEESVKYAFNKSGKIISQFKNTRAQKYYYSKKGNLIKKVMYEGKKISATYTTQFNAKGQKIVEYITYPKQKPELLRKYFYEDDLLVKEIYFDDKYEEVTEYRYEFY